ncbi:hypothetical protein Tco_0665505 [Tanacetum coccineum]
MFHFAPKPIGLLHPPKNDNPAKDAICHQCGKVGTEKELSRVITTGGLMKKKKRTQGIALHVVVLIFVLLPRVYGEVALSLYVGDGHRAAVEAIGTYHLELPMD